MKDHALDKAIGISLVMHGLLLLFVIGIVFPKWQKAVKHQATVEISYREVKKPHVHVNDYPIKPVQQLDLNQDNLLLNNSQRMPVPLTKTTRGQLPPGLMMESKPERWKNLSTAHQRITITPIKSEKINNPAYAAYNEMVRSRIEEKVYANYDRLEAGAVYLTFIVASDGSLKAYQVITERTTASSHLQEVSLDSLQQAGPFPPFLKGMTLPEYTFNIEVQYQISE